MSKNIGLSTPDFSNLEDSCSNHTFYTPVQEIPIIQPSDTFEAIDQSSYQEFSNIETFSFLHDHLLYFTNPTISLLEKLDQSSLEPILQINNEIPTEGNFNHDSSDIDSIDDLGIVNDEADWEENIKEIELSLDQPISDNDLLSDNTDKESDLKENLSIDQPTLDDKLLWDNKYDYQQDPPDYDHYF